VEGALVVILVLGDPGRIDNRSRLLRGVSVTLVVVMASSATWSTLRLIEDITGGGAETNSASALLRNGSSVWATTVWRSPCFSSNSTVADQPSGPNASILVAGGGITVLVCPMVATLVLTRRSREPVGQAPVP